VGTDACSVSTVQTNGPPPGSNFSLGQTRIEYTATDASGNTQSCNFSVTVLDDNNPQITCPANVSVQSTPGQCGAIVTYGAVHTSDCIASTFGSDHAIGSGNFFSVGVHEELYIVSNTAGMNASCVLYVTVFDTQAPNISCPADVIISNDPGQCSAVLRYPHPTGYDSCMGFVNATLVSGVGVGGVLNASSSVRTRIVARCERLAGTMQRDSPCVGR